MKVCFLIPEYVTDYYGRSAFCLMHECSRFDSTINEFDASCDIVFSTCFLDSKMGRLYSKIKKSHPEKIFINYLWDLPFWRADPQREQKSLFSISGLIPKRSRISMTRLFRSSIITVANIPLNFSRQ